MPRGYPKNPKAAAKRGPKSKAEPKQVADTNGVKQSAARAVVVQASEGGGFLTLRGNLETLAKLKQLGGGQELTRLLDSEIIASVEALGVLRKQVFGETDKGLSTSPSAPSLSAPPLPSPVSLPVPPPPSA